MAIRKKVSGKRPFLGLAVFLAVLVLGGAAVMAVAQTDADQAQTDTEAAIDTRQATQEDQDAFAGEKADLVRRFRAARANVEWLGDRRAAEVSRVDAVEQSIAELRRRLAEADRLEGSMQDTLMGIFLRLRESVDRSKPFLPAERTLRLDTVADELAQPGTTSAEKLRRLLETLQVEAGYGSTIEVYQDLVEVGGESLHADILRLGRLSLFWRTPDGDRVGTWDEAAGKWVELSGGAKRRIELAMEMASRMRPIEIIDLPLGRINP